MTASFSETMQAGKGYEVKSLEHWKKNIVNLQFYTQLKIFKKKWNKIFF